MLFLDQLLLHFLIIMEFPLALLKKLRAANHVVVFTGAGVSAESGIPTFRDALTGLWTKYDAAQLATPDAFAHNPALVWGWYEWRRMKVMNAVPNDAHRAIARLATLVPRLTLVTQNVDDLHERAGSDSVLHMHGSILKHRCALCGAPYDAGPAAPVEPEGGREVMPPACPQPHCTGLVRPGVVWFNEANPVAELRAAFEAAETCDVLFSVGTSGVVAPANRVPVLAAQKGATVVQVNPFSTTLDKSAAFNLVGAAGAILPKLFDDAFKDLGAAAETA